MAEIFFSYSSKDRQRVRPIHNALVTQGFDVFWDQSVPAGTDWDTWIRQQLGKAKCAVVIWSLNSAASDNVRHEATVAKHQGKLVPVLLDCLTPEQFPMGLFTVQGANLTSWNGDVTDEEWLKLKTEVQNRLSTPWMRQIIEELQTELLAEKSRWEAVEQRSKRLQEQLGKEARMHLELKRDREQALTDMEVLKTDLQRVEHDRANLKNQVADLSQRLERTETLHRNLGLENAAAREKISELTEKFLKVQHDRDAAIHRASAILDHSERSTLEQRILALTSERNELLSKVKQLRAQRNAAVMAAARDRQRS
jgi:TIR domain